MNFKNSSYIVVSIFSDSGMGLVLSMIRSSPDVKQIYNWEANDVGPV